MKIGYVGSFLLPTGYAEAAREHIKALDNVGVDVGAVLYQTPHPLLHNELIRNDHRVNQLIEVAQKQKPFDPDIWVVHLTPDAIQSMGKPTVCYAVWELDKLPAGWAERLNATCVGLMTSSELSKQAFVRAGLTIPVWIVPHPIDLERYNLDVKPSPKIALLREKYTTVFYLSAQWMPRKGVEDVLTAYLTEFTPDEKVVLLAQIWRNSHTASERRAVREQVGIVRGGLNISDQPDIVVLGNRMDRWEMPSVYAGIDVHVTASRGEAFSLPIFEAAACGKPTISTGWGGQWDYLDTESAYPVDYTMEPVHGVGGVWKHYNARQQWARANINSLRQRMRWTHEHKDDAKTKGLKATEIVAEKMSYPVVGNMMKSILQSLVEVPVAV